MSESGCSRDVACQNLEVAGTANFASGSVIHKDRVVLLTDAAGAGANRGALTLQDSGTHFIVPALTVGDQTIALPAVSAANVGFTIKATMLGTAAQNFEFQTAAGDDKIITVLPDGDGTVTVATNSDNAGFQAAATVGCSFRLTMVSATAATAFMLSEVNTALAANVGATAIRLS
jgi:hypothetical protein